MKLFISVILLTFSIITFGQNNLITNNSIGSLELCQSINNIKLPFISDTLFNADGFYFYGRYYRDNTGKVLASIGEDSILNRLRTTSDKFKNTSQIGVNSSLSELLNSSDSIYVTSVIAENPDFYLFQRYPDSRIEYRLNLKGNSCFYEHEILDKDYLISELDGVTEKANEVGNRAKIISIWIVPTNSCKK